MTAVPACGIMINEVSPKWNSIWALSHIAKHWPVKTTIKRKNPDLFLQFSQTHRAFVVKCFVVKWHLNWIKHSNFKSLFFWPLYMMEDYCKSALEISQVWMDVCTEERPSLCCVPLRWWLLSEVSFIYLFFNCRKHLVLLKMSI